MEKQTPEGLGHHMDTEMSEALPDAMEKHFDKIVRRLGLYRGPVIEDFRGMVRTVMTTQAAAYYDAETKRIYILDGGSNDLEEGIVYSHELYHALQDQYFDLGAYVSPKLKLNSDQSMARTAVVEGEATYIHTLWGMRQMLGGTPPRAMIAPAIKMQSDLSIADLMNMVGGTAADAAKAENIPPFMLETLIGNYLKGAAFVYAVQEKGWSEVEKLYKEYPPQSTEQILHPEKWLAHENPAIFQWSDLDKEKALKDWEQIDDDVIGEIQWRIIFKVQGQEADAAAASAGWNGDRYAVFKRRNSDDTLLLLRTAWDSQADAVQFADAYRHALAVKYAGTTEPTRVEQQGTDVFIVEGGAKSELDALMQIVRKAKRRPN